jgi:diguanylate cyclase (GGDEF)-like protein
MIDIDHFKSINDRFGHEAGDQVIKSVASIVQRAAHDNGSHSATGAGFWCCFPVPMNQRHACAQKIYNSVHELSLRYGLTEIGPVDVSIGIASYRNMPRLTTCCAPRMFVPGEKSWAARIVSFWDAGGGLADYRFIRALPQ